MCREVFVALSSNQVSVLSNFYKELFELVPSVEASGYAEFQTKGLKIAIFAPKAENATEFLAPSSGAMSLCLEVSDLEATISRLAALGYPAPGDIMNTSHGREIYAYDPDGNRLILHQSSD